MTKRGILAAFLFLTVYISGRTQVDSDPLGPAFRLQQREALRKRMPAQSCAVLFSGGTDRTSQGHIGAFRPTANFRYFSGLASPDAILVIFAEAAQLAEGDVKALLFLPDKSDLLLAATGRHYTGKFGLQADGLAIRPAGQWPKFCREVLAADRFTKILAEPGVQAAPSAVGPHGYAAQLAEFYRTVRPGHGFDRRSQSYYARIVSADTSNYRALQQEIAAALSYRAPGAQDPVLVEFVEINDPRALQRLQARLRRIRLDVTLLPETAAELRMRKAPGEVRLLSETSVALSEAMKRLRSESLDGINEFQLLGKVYEGLYRQNLLPGAGTRVASGKRTGFPNYLPSQDATTVEAPLVIDLVGSKAGYHARITRTLPLSGGFSPDMKALHAAVQQFQDRIVNGCRPGKPLQTWLEALRGELLDKVKALGFATTNAARRKVLVVVSVAQIGLDAEEGESPGTLDAGMALTVETAVYLPQHKDVKAAMRGKGCVLRDVVVVDPDGPRHMTAD